MRGEGLFINGVFEGVLLEILELQEPLPEQILYMQPYSKKAMAHLKAQRPSVDEPMQLPVSTTKDLGLISFAGEIVGWYDKRRLNQRTRNAISRVIWTLQPG